MKSQLPLNAGACQAGEALIHSLSAFILKFLCNARNGMTRIASYLRNPMTKQCIKIFMKVDSVNESVLSPSLPSFLPCRDFWSPEFLCGFRLTLIFFTFPEKVEGERRYPFEFRHSIPAFPMAILEIYGMPSFKAAGLFMSLYYTLLYK